jgi:flagellar protein FlgJ
MLTGANTDVYNDFNGLAKLKQQAKKEAPEALKKAAQQFEAIFLSNILKEMRQAKLSEGLLDNDQSHFYNEMYDQQLALHLSGTPGVGLADMIVKQLSPHHNSPKNTTHSPSDTPIQPSQSTSVASNNPSAYRPNPLQTPHNSINSTLPLTPGQATLRAYLAETDSSHKIQVTPFQLNTPLPIRSQIHQSISSTTDFVTKLHPLAQKAAAKLGIDPKALLAQAALESGWGKAVIKHKDGSSSYNLFNIKADKSWQGKQTRITTLEFEQGITKKVNAGFRAYSSYEESFNDYVDFIQNNPRYADALKKTAHTEHYMHELQQSGYASDPNYANKVIEIYHSDTINNLLTDNFVAMN